MYTGNIALYIYGYKLWISICLWHDVITWFMPGLVCQKITDLALSHIQGTTQCDKMNSSTDIVFT